MNLDEEFDAVIKVIAPRKFDLWRHLLAGAYARVDVAEQRADDAESRYAGLMQENAELKRELDNVRGGTVKVKQKAHGISPIL